MFNVKRIEEYDPNLRARMTTPSVPRIIWFRENSQDTQACQKKTTFDRASPIRSEGRQGAR